MNLFCVSLSGENWFWLVMSNALKISSLLSSEDITLDQYSGQETNIVNTAAILNCV